MKKRRRPACTLTGIIHILAGGVLILTVFGFLGRLHWFLDLFSHFRVQYMQLCLPIIGFYLWRRMNKHAAAVILLAAVNYSFVLPFYFSKPAVPTHKPNRAMLLNLLASNGNSAQVLETIRTADPDLVVLEEFTPAWAEHLEALHSVYPHRISRPQTDCFGICLLSKYPIRNGGIIEISRAGLPSVTADIYLPDGKITVIGTHPLPPLGGRASGLRNEQLAALPAIIQQQRLPVLLIGDLNASPWTPHFRSLIQSSGLKNSMKGFGFQPSWPADRFFLKIPIDHILHSETIAVYNRMVGQSVGSDHLPVIVDFGTDQ